MNNMTLIETHRIYLVKLIHDYLKSLKKNYVDFVNKKCIIGDKICVSRIFLYNDEVYIKAYDRNFNEEYDENLNAEEYDDLFLTQLLYEIESKGANLFTWIEQKDGKTINQSCENFVTFRDGYNAMRMAVFVEIENLTQNGEKLDLQFCDESITLLTSDKIEIKYSILKTIL